MQIHQLIEAARYAIAQDASNGNIAGGKMAMFVPGQWPAGGDKKRLAGRQGGPLGQCISEEEDGVICVFDAQEVLAWALKQPHVKPLETT